MNAAAEARADLIAVSVSGDAEVCDDKYMFRVEKHFEPFKLYIKKMDSFDNEDVALLHV